MNNDLFTTLGDILRPQPETNSGLHPLFQEILAPYMPPVELPTFCWGVKDGNISILDNAGNASTPPYLGMMGILSGDNNDELADKLNACLSISKDQRKQMEALCR